MGGIGDGSIQVLVFCSNFSIVLIDHKLGQNMNGRFVGCHIFILFCNFICLVRASHIHCLINLTVMEP